MKNVSDYLEAWSRRERIVQKAEKIMKEGDVWSYPVGLEEGVDYSFKVSGCKNGEVTCTLTNGNGTSPLREAKGKEFVFSFVPEKSGTYGLTLSLDPTPRSPEQGKVVVTLSKEYMPTRYLDGMFR